MFQNSTYITGAANKSQYPNQESLPEFLFLGRSNVGKSSLINALTNRKALARISAQPGKTRVLNFYLINNSFYLVDAPGYGYAVRSKQERLSYGHLIEEYLQNNENLKFVFLLVDTKVGATVDDVTMFDFLKHYQIPTIIIATKSDKVGRTKVFQHHQAIINKLEISKEDLILTSSQEKTGLNNIVDIITSTLK